jgi:hypothetical protein
MLLNINTIKLLVNLIYDIMYSRNDCVTRPMNMRRTVYIKQEFVKIHTKIIIKHQESLHKAI